MVAVLLLVALTLEARPVFAVDIPFTRLFFGGSLRSLLDDEAHYPHSYVTAEYSYWDIYYERRGARLHSYHQQSGSLTTIYRTNALLLGGSAWIDDLSLDQENVYTDTDRMVGSADDVGAKAIVGYTIARDLPLGVTAIEAVGAAGADSAFVGDLEIRLSWGSRVNLLVKGETFSSEIEIEEEVLGSTFPFHFPFNTDRWFGRLQVDAPTHFHFRTWGLYETNQGEDDVVQGFENRLWVERAGIGGSVDYRLEPWYRLDVAPRPSPDFGRGPGLRARFDYTTIDSDIEMRYNDVRYLHLDGLQCDNVVARLDVVPLRWWSIFGGWERLEVEHHGDSFFDVWPFTIWDIFTAKRYRLDDMESTLDTWFAGSAARVESGRFRGELAGRFEWWDSATELDWLERVDVLFPFFFRYERHSESSSFDTEHAVQVDLALWWRFGSAALRLAGRATIPLDEDEPAGAETPGGPPGPGGPPPPPPTDDSTHGGLIGTIELCIGY